MVTRLGFTMFHLERYENHASGKPAFVPVQVMRSRSAMSVFSAANRAAR